MGIFLPNFIQGLVWYGKDKLNSMIHIFLLISCVIVFWQYKLEGKVVNLISIFMMPYIFNVAINNTLACNVLGFFKISDEVLGMLTLAFVSFFIGSLPASISMCRNCIVEEDNNYRFSNYHLSMMLMLVTAIGIIGGGKFLYMYFTGGFSAENFSINEGAMGSGIIGHMLLLSQSLIPIIFLYWTYNLKKISYLLPLILIMLVIFSTFVKYNIIGLAVNIFIFVLIYRRSMLFKAISILCLFTVVIFIANYAISFWVRNTVVIPSFYINHLWTYISGSIIYDNYIFSEGVRVGISTFDKLLIFIYALPNMFFNKLLGFKVHTHVRQEALAIGEHGQRSNVTDAIGYLYPSGGNLGDIAVFAIVMVIIGFLFTFIYMYSKQKYTYFNTFISIFLTYFVFFSFFGTFYINPGPWESLVYALIIPRFFVRKRCKLG